MQNERIKEYKNKKASYLYQLDEHFIAGLRLKGTEIKSIRSGKVNFTDAYCHFVKQELFVHGLHIAEYSHGNMQNHDPNREKKCLLQKRELRKIWKKIKEKGFTMIPVALFIDNRGLAKLEIAVARGKKMYDKREDIKKKDLKRDHGKLDKV